MCHLTPDGRTLLTGGTHGGPDAAVPPDSPTLFTQIWDVATLKEIARANWRLGTPAFSPDSKLVAIVTDAGRVVADTRTGNVVTVLRPDPATPGAPAPRARPRRVQRGQPRRRGLGA